MKRTLRPPKYCHHKAKGLAYVTLPVDGRRKVVYLGKYNSRASLDRYEEVVGNWLAKRPIRGDDTTLKIRDVAERFKSACESESQRNKYDIAAASRILVELFGDRPVVDFDGLLFDRFKRELVKRDYSLSYANSLIRFTKRAFRWAMQRRLIEPDQFALIDSIETLTSREAATRVVLPVDDAIVDATLPSLSPTLADLVRFMRATGCRPGEARMLRVGDIDRQRWIVSLGRHKTAHKGKLRFLVIPPEARQIVLPRLTGEANQLVFESPKGGEFDRRALGRAIDRAIKRINKERKKAGRAHIPHWHPYQLRHSRAVEVRENYGVELCQVLLGHSKIDTSQVYAKLTRQRVEELARQLE